MHSHTTLIHNGKSSAQRKNSSPWFNDDSVIARLHAMRCKKPFQNLSEIKIQVWICYRPSSFCAADLLADHLCELFNFISENNLYLESWTRGIVVPVPKKEI